MAKTVKDRVSDNLASISTMATWKKENPRADTTEAFMYLHDHYNEAIIKCSAKIRKLMAMELDYELTREEYEAL